MTPPRVLLLSHDLSRSGAPQIALDTFELLQAVTDVRVVSIFGGPLEARARALGPTKILATRGPAGPGTRSIASRGISMLGRRATTEVWVRRWRPDVVYANSVASLPIVRHIRMPRAPVLLHVHESPVLLSCLLAASGTRADLLSLPDRYIAVSDFVRDGLIDAFGVEAARVTVIPAFIRQERFDGRLRPAATSKVRFTVGAVANASWYKGGDLWLLTAAEVKRRLGAGGVRFVWAGLRDDDGGRQFAAMVQKLDLGDIVEMAGETDDPLGAMDAFDVLAITSWEDSAPLTALEAMAMGKPVICFASGGGTPAIVGSTGVVVPEFSPVAMAEAIAILAESPSEVVALGARARARVLEEFTAQTQVPRVWTEIAGLAQRDARGS